MVDSDGTKLVIINNTEATVVQQNPQTEIIRTESGAMSAVFFGNSLVTCDGEGNFSVISKHETKCYSFNESGFGVSMKVIGDYIAVGNPKNGSVVFLNSSFDVAQTLISKSFTSSQMYGIRLASSGSILVVGTQTGTVDIVGNINGEFVIRATLSPKESDIGDNYGCSLAVFGDLIAVGSSMGNEYKGIVYVYKYTTEGVILVHILKQPFSSVDWFSSKFGESLLFFGDRLFVGSPDFSVVGVVGVGIVTSFSLSNANYMKLDEMYIPNKRQLSLFGRLLAPFGKRFAVVARGGLCTFPLKASTAQIVIKIGLEHVKNTTEAAQQISFNIIAVLGIEKERMTFSLKNQTLTVKIREENLMSQTITTKIAYLIDTLFSPTYHGAPASLRSKMQMTFSSPVSVDFVQPSFAPTNFLFVFVVSILLLF
ncbi:hypothetical protein EIN_430510 [Entamoeba invadens IP1]|uniref:Uncharacterized protein n=1 Tax=Entamoeba invadens IP1 TaxID=370355 RepID=A0A0A1UF77_ENTIV|nr:hypothetical protein EIN_430510 [Entamoeba invadens IP1]ELP95245.1 hypothetical protein EIN_430510 [Entamoeba invadens IP1]|eukprot:XP_004262016.1 hypothetical protein EIN_430510 [Entamoeba invadens IP1]